jgi:hypothetical protein
VAVIAMIVRLLETELEGGQEEYEDADNEDD